MHHFILSTLKQKLLAADKTIQTFAVITVCKVYVPSLQMIVFAENLLAHGKSSSKSSKN